MYRCSLLQAHNIPFQVHVDAVEIDDAIARVAKEQFGFEEGDRVKLHIENGLKFVERIAAGKLFDFISLFITHAEHENIDQYLSTRVGEGLLPHTHAHAHKHPALSALCLSHSIFPVPPIIILHKPYSFNVAESSPPRYDIVLFDVDSKDSSVGMSCPPRSFVAAPLVATVRNAVLKPEGISCVFVAACLYIHLIER